MSEGGREGEARRARPCNILNIFAAQNLCYFHVATFVADGNFLTLDRSGLNFNELLSWKLSDTQYTLKLDVKPMFLDSHLFPSIFLGLVFYVLLTSWKTKRSSVDSYGIKDCVKSLHYHTYAMRTYQNALRLTRLRCI